MRKIVRINILLACVCLALPGLAVCGDLEPAAAPGSTMHTLTEIYDLVGGIQTQVNGIQSQASDIQTQVGNIQTQVGNIQAQVEDIQAQVENLQANLVALVTTENYTNSLGMTFRQIPAGTFTMGSPTTELGRRDTETQHEVTLTQPFCMQTTEVTQGQWVAVMGGNPSGHSSCGDDCPVENVSWDDVQDFIAELKEQGYGEYRLPTEAEWEYAARAGSTAAFANGDITVPQGLDPNLNLMGWFDQNSSNTTHEVAQKQANAWGLHDMHGNVCEWVQDWRQADLGSSSVTDPTGPSSGAYRVLRGGSYFNFASACRSAFRTYNDPGNRFAHLGFRLVRLPGQ